MTLGRVRLHELDRLGEVVVGIRFGNLGRQRDAGLSLGETGRSLPTRTHRLAVAALLTSSAALVALGGCISIKTITIGTKTSLERQLMGELEPLSEEEILLSSVRAADGGNVGQGTADALQSAAVAARRRQLFNRDDVDELKAAGCVGEANDATLAERPCSKPVGAELESLRSRLLGEENADRAAILDWAVANDPALTPKDRPRIAGVYRRILAEQGKVGEWTQQDDGSWVQKK